MNLKLKELMLFQLEDKNYSRLSNIGFTDYFILTISISLIIINLNSNRSCRRKESYLMERELFKSALST